MRRIIHFLGICAALAAGFGWGFAAHRNHVVPYWQVKVLGQHLGWARIPPQAEVPRNELQPDGPDREALERLQTLPYVTGTFDPHAERRGVIEHDPDRAAPGLNLYGPVTEPRAYLVDMAGREVHRWSHGRAPWTHRELLPDGGLLATVTDRRLLALDRGSRLRWSHRARFHHGVTVADDGRIYALTRRDRRVPWIHPTVDCVEDFVTVLEPDGRVVEEISLLEAVRESPYAGLLPVPPDGVDREEGALDVLHANHVEPFDGSLAHRSPLYARGNLLVSFRNPSAIAILDGRTHDVLWLWGPNNLVFQHHPTLLGDGNLLVFDNGLRRSRVLEVDPLARRIVWSYTADDLFTRTRGSVQRLSNGNTLITESDTGYVFEVTPEGERVWVFAGPHFTPNGRRAAIWRMARYERESRP